MGTLINTKYGKICEIEIGRVSSMSYNDDEKPEPTCEKQANSLERSFYVCKKIFKILLLVAFIFFLIFAWIHDQEKVLPLIIFSCVLALGFIYYKVIKKRWGSLFMKAIGRPFVQWTDKIWRNRWLRW